MVLGVLVAGLTAAEGFLHYGQRWQHFRSSAEVLKSEGWKFSQLVDPYGYRNHREAFAPFVGRAEAMLRRELETYMTEVIPQRPESQPPPQPLDRLGGDQQADSQ
jgi:hypothetical protein